jgi:PAS domain S-box-containing protein
MPSLTKDSIAKQGGRRAQPVRAASASARELPREDFYYNALDAVPGHILILDTHHDAHAIVFANVAAARDYGYERCDLTGRPFLSLVDTAGTATEEIERLRQAMSSGEKLRTELRMVRRDGSKFTAGVTFAALTDERGQLTHVVCSGRDISSALEEQRQRRELQERLYAEMRERERMAIELRMAHKLEAVGRLASGIAHEINTPIQFVGDGVSFLQGAVADLRQLLDAYEAAVQALARGEPVAEVSARIAAVANHVDQTLIESEIPGAFERTQEGIERVAAIVRAMREFAHPETREHASADINRAIQTTLLVARNEYKYCATVHTELGALPHVRCNVNELNQVFVNLIINAAHAIEAAGRDMSSGQIRITTTAGLEGIEIVFEDNGCGIPAENLDRIFDPFFTTKEVGKGTGQGLAIARSIIVERHRGTITVDSEVNRGTRMTLRLPMDATESVLSTSEPSTSEFSHV